MPAAADASMRSASRRLSAEERRAQLLEVAASLFAERGYRSTTMDDVAEAAGVTKPVLYQHFSSKKALYLELVDGVAQRVLEALGAATADQAPRGMVEGGLLAYFRLLVEDPAAFRLLYDRDHGDDEDLGRAVRRVERILVEAVDPLIEAGLDDEHRLILAAGVIGMAEGASVAWITSVDAMAPPTAALREAEAERLARRVGSLLWAGLRSVRSD